MSLIDGQSIAAIGAGCDGVWENYGHSSGAYVFRNRLQTGSIREMQDVFGAGAQVLDHGRSLAFDEAELLADYRRVVALARSPRRSQEAYIDSNGLFGVWCVRCAYG